MGSRGDSYDNALAESFNGLYKAELIHRRGPWKGVEDVEWATLTYVDWFNNRRLHAEIGMVPPASSKPTTTVRTPRPRWPVPKPPSLYETRGGSRQLCEAAWAYQHTPNVGVGIRERQQGVPPETVARSWAAQSDCPSGSTNWPPTRTLRSVVAAAVARELAGFLWAEMVAEV